LVPKGEGAEPRRSGIKPPSAVRLMRLPA
jgi:hypothetical protein